MRRQRDTPNRLDEGLNVFGCVVERERGPDRAFDPKPAQDRLGAMMACPDRDAFAVKRFADVLGAALIDEERNDAPHVRAARRQASPRGLS